ncbi:MAG: 50S ribosomal protein L24 [Patescibacteria group bacterium]|nr:MAG: 50S ribosomal protein L24 [Patescibacteria group bacterium]
MKPKAGVKKIKIRKGDKVKVLSGKDRGREGKVEKVLLAEGKVIVSGINVVKHFTKKTQDEPGGIVEREAPIGVSKIALVCPKCRKATRWSKNRVCKSCGAKSKDV